VTYGPGDTFLSDGPNPKKPPHLYVVVCVDACDRNLVFAVPFCTDDFSTDKTLVLDVGAHPRIKHKTSVSYDLITTVNMQKIEQLAESQKLLFRPTFVFSRQDPVGDDLLEMITRKALESDMMPERMHERLRACLDGNTTPT